MHVYIYIYIFVYEKFHIGIYIYRCMYTYLQLVAMPGHLRLGLALVTAPLHLDGQQMFLFMKLATCNSCEDPIYKHPEVDIINMRSTLNILKFL